MAAERNAIQRYLFCHNNEFVVMFYPPEYGERGFAVFFYNECIASAPNTGGTDKLHGSICGGGNFDGEITYRVDNGHFGEIKMKWNGVEYSMTVSKTECCCTPELCFRYKPFGNDF